MFWNNQRTSPVLDQSVATPIGVQEQTRSVHVLYFEGSGNGQYRYFVFETDKLHNILFKFLRFQGNPSFSTNIKPLFMNTLETRK